MTVRCVEDSRRITEERTGTGASVFGRDGRKFIFGGGTQGVRAHNDVAEGITILATCGELRCDQIGVLTFWGALGRRPKSRQAVGEMRVGLAVGFDGIGEGLHGVDGRMFVGLDFGAIPLLA